MILSDRSIREEIAAGRIVIEPFEDSHVQPSSVDLRIDRFFRVFRNHTMGYIDVKKDQQELTELVEIAEDDVFILHPGEFVLGSTLERVALPSDLVARLEGKSSLGRLGLLIHSSLPCDEEILFYDGAGLRLRRVDELVHKQAQGSVVSYDPDTFEAIYSPVTGWFEGRADRIYEVTLDSGRSVRVTAGHNLFTLDPDGDIRKVRAQELSEGTFVAVPRRVPEAPSPASSFDLRELVPEGVLPRMLVGGPTIRAAEDDGLGPDPLHGSRRTRARHHSTYELSADVVRMAPSLWRGLGPGDYLRPLGSTSRLPVVWEVDEDLAWLIGVYVAGGSCRRDRVVFPSTDESLTSRVEAVLSRCGLPHSRRKGSITCASKALSLFMEWTGTGTTSSTMRLPSPALGWAPPLLEALVEGLLVGAPTTGDGRRQCFATPSRRLASDALYLASRLGLQASVSSGARVGDLLYEVSLARSENALLNMVPLPDRLLVDARHLAALSQVQTAQQVRADGATAGCDLGAGSARDGAMLERLRRVAAEYRELIPHSPESRRLSRLVDGDVAWDRVARVVDTGSVEPVYDLEVRPGGRKIENFVAGTGGVFVANTAGFVDASFDGHLTLELSNVANLPITLYPGMKVGQISFLRMTTEAEHPYGSKEAGSKYQHQRGPTPSRYFENFGTEEGQGT